jgi:predicted nucleotidyltransferase
MANGNPVNTHLKEVAVQDPVLREIVQRLVKAFGPTRLYLFGSVARNEHDIDSDYDLLMVVPVIRGSSHRLSQEAHKMLWDLGIAVDILVWTEEAFTSRLHLRASLPATVEREGRLLYAA